MSKIELAEGFQPSAVRLSADERWRSYIQVEETGCWTWTGRLSQDGYGRFKVGGRRVPAARWTYERWVGPIPKGMEPDHLCLNRACVNPMCLEIVTHRENILRKWARHYARRVDKVDNSPAYSSP
jgi:HNH endonuclease